MITMNNDLISRQKAIEAVEHITSSMSVCVNTDECHGMKRMQRQAVIELANLPSTQPKQNDAEFWRKRSDEYEKMFLDLYWRMMNGVKFESMQFDKNGITLKIKESSQEDNT